MCSSAPFLLSTTCRQANGERDDRGHQAELPALTERATLDLMPTMPRLGPEVQDLLPCGVWCYWPVAMARCSIHRIE